MKVLQEVLTIDNSVNIDKIIPGFSEKFEDKIRIFRITVCCDFEIDLKEEFRLDTKLKSEIKKFIKLELSNIEVLFIDNQLPF